MNPLEDRIAKVPLSKPDAAWRDEILKGVASNSSRSWKEWVWPSPLAWAALILIWLGLAISTGIEARQKKPARSGGPPRYYVVPDAKELRALLAQRR